LITRYRNTGNEKQGLSNRSNWKFGQLDFKTFTEVKAFCLKNYMEPFFDFEEIANQQNVD